MEFIEKFFELKKNKTTVKTEVYAGITTFMTMAYILIVNPVILGNTGMDKGALLTATALASIIGTLAMAFLANYPFALAPGMGLNAFFAFSVVLGMGYSWQFALTAVFAEGLIFIVLSLLDIREAIFNAIPATLKMAVGVGIGLFITFIGLQNSGIIIHSDATLVQFGNIHDIRVILALLGTVITVALVIRKVKGALFWGILATYFIGVFCQLVGLYKVNVDAGVYSLIPSGIISLPHSIKPIFMKFEFNKIFSLDFLVIIFSFLFVNVFDTIGTLIGVSAKTGFLDKDGKLPRIKGALLADAVATTVGACLGTSTVTAYVESAAGVAEGGKTGFTSFITAMLFLVALIFTPIITVIPSFATTPALIVVGLFMIESVLKIDFSDFSEGFPAFIAIVMMPLTYSISDGLIFGVLSYVGIKLLTGKAKQLNPIICGTAVIFLIKLFV